jgi:predicted P-loop ATPase
VNPISGHGYLKDPTGNMRFWPVTTAVAHPIDRARLHADAEQIWAEAVHLYKSGFKWYPSLPEMEALFVPQQETRREVDPWEGAIRRYVRDNIPEEIKRKTKTGISTGPGYITSETLMRDVLGLELQRHDALSQKRVAQLMHLLGWESRRVSDLDSRFRAWVRGPKAEGPSGAAEADAATDDLRAVDYSGEVECTDGQKVRMLS